MSRVCTKTHDAPRGQRGGSTPTWRSGLDAADLPGDRRWDTQAVAHSRGALVQRQPVRASRDGTHSWRVGCQRRDRSRPRPRRVPGPSADVGTRPWRVTSLVVEHCPQCGFDGAAWTDHDATTMITQLPARFAASIDGIPDGELQRRPVTSMWSIAEYLDHVR